MGDQAGPAITPEGCGLLRVEQVSLRNPGASASTRGHGLPSRALKCHSRARGLAIIFIRHSRSTRARRAGRRRGACARLVPPSRFDGWSLGRDVDRAASGLPSSLIEGCGEPMLRLRGPATLNGKKGSDAQDVEGDRLTSPGARGSW
jgi:hypothetical protein